MTKNELQNLRDQKMLKTAKKVCTLGKIKNASLFKLKNPDEICFQLVDEAGHKIEFFMDSNLYSGIDELVLTLTLSKHGLLPDGMWVHNLDVDEIMEHLRERCTSFERINF